MYNLIRIDTKKHQLAFNDQGQLEPFLIASGKLAQRHTPRTILATITTKLGFYEIQVENHVMLMQFAVEEFRLLSYVQYDKDSDSILHEECSLKISRLLHQLNRHPFLATYIANMSPYPANGYEWIDLLHDVSGNVLTEFEVVEQTTIKVPVGGRNYFAIATDMSTVRDRFAWMNETQANNPKGGVGFLEIDTTRELILMPCESDLIIEWFDTTPEDTTGMVHLNDYYARFYRLVNGRLRPITLKDIPVMYHHQLHQQLVQQASEHVQVGRGRYLYAVKHMSKLNDIFYHRSIYSVATAISRLTHNPSINKVKYEHDLYT